MSLLHRLGHHSFEVDSITPRECGKENCFIIMKHCTQCPKTKKETFADYYCDEHLTFEGYLTTRGM